VLVVLRVAVAKHSAPEYIRSDNGPEFIAHVIQRWLRANTIKTIYIEPGLCMAERVYGKFQRSVSAGMPEPRFDLHAE